MMPESEHAKTDRPESEPLLRSILDAVQDAMVVIDDQGRILWFSAAAQKMFGYAEDEVFGENVSTLMPSPDRERHDGYLRHYRETGERKIIGIGRITTARRRDGSTFPIELTIGEATSNGIRVFTGFIRDLTERQRTEKRLHNLQDELAHVSRVTAMGTLATAIAHELNQPLTAIANYVEASKHLLSEASPEHVSAVLEALEECAGEAVRAGQIVRRLRDFIKRGDTDRQAVPLSRLVNEASALAFMSTGSRALEFDVSVGAGEHVLADKIQIQQVLLNLIRNAIEAMEETPLKQLKISSRKAPGGMIEVQVADSGPGLPAAVARDLFQPFQSTKAAGMGVGLSISRTIIEAHEGRIWVSSSPLGGAAFHFTLPDATAGELLD
ncbi:PAS domain S-box protein [Altererythrobacter aerius]|uniref:Sensor protein FixL n=1 Tax=Tsuneonella aeria TaxID=1837929 RepID=A0A6I4TFN7_9SPHN|nr:PAS domain-containing sensor histidine kinase [Tsuneonella aeria]MXO76151.1 PAS domain S-box protein [Tsuneonella aeria]